MPWFQKKNKLQVDDTMTLEQLLHEASISRDPGYAYRCLERAEVMAPDSLKVQRALLMHGRLHERDRRAADYSVIKCYLLHAFEHPERHPEAEQQRMARELFDHRRLQACLALAEDPQAFLNDYLEELSQEYMRLFIAGDSSHAPRVFGISPRQQLHRYLARPAADVIRNLLLSPFLSEEEQLMAARAFYRAFYKQMQGQTKDLDRLLGAEICGVLA